MSGGSLVGGSSGPGVVGRAVGVVGPLVGVIVGVAVGVTVTVGVTDGVWPPLGRGRGDCLAGGAAGCSLLTWTGWVATVVGDRPGM